MELPNVNNIIDDTKRKVRYNVVAYRQLSRDEVIGAVRYYLATAKKKPKKNTSITLVSMIGANDW